tara:strand:+ start:1608 stop:2030 length:423 start_codon:yes stop_codon:yes gene_type:complete
MDTKLMPIDINFLDTDYIYDGYDIVDCDIEWMPSLEAHYSDFIVDIKIKKVTLNLQNDLGDYKTHEWVGDLHLVENQITENKIIDEFYDTHIEYDGSLNQLYNGFKPSQIFIKMATNKNNFTKKWDKISDITIHFGGEND